MQLKKNSKRLSWITVLLLLQKSPYLPIAKNLTVKFSILAEKVWTWKMVIPTAVSSASWHALSGATTYVTTSDSNPSSGNEGDDFSFSFYNHGYKAFSYKVENLPDGLTFNNNINGPKITGTLPSAGTYTIDITGYRYSALSGNSTPTYNLILNVSEKQVISTIQTNNNISTNTDNNEEIQNSQEEVDDSTTTQISSQQNTISNSLWSDSNTTNLGSGWYNSSWFGNFYGNSGGWTYHLKHGWLYIHGNDESDLWIFDETLGWLYTGKNLFPKLYRNSTQSWIFDQSDVNNRKFWDYKNSVSLQPPKN